MNSKSLLVAAILAAVLVIAGLFATGNDNTAAKESTGAGEVLMAGLYDQMGEVAEVTVKTSEGEFHVKSSDGQWVLAERGGYPVQVDRVRSALIAIAELKTVERKTADPMRYGQLGVQPVGSDAGAETQSKEIVMKNAAGDSLASLIIGKSRSGGRGGTFYVRRPEEDSSWLVEGELPNLPSTGDAWLDKKVLEVKRNDVSAARITHADGEVLTISKADADTNFSVHDLPADRELTYEGVAGGIAGALQYVNFQDVMPADEFEAPESQLSVTNLWTKDGLRVTAQLWEKDEKVFASFQAAYDMDGKPTMELGPMPPTEAEGEEGIVEATATPRPKEEVESEAAELNERLSPWIFELPPFTKTNLTKRMDGLLKPLPEPEAEATEEGGDDPEAPISIDSFGGPVEDEHKPDDAGDPDDDEEDGGK